jgi:Na+-transporting NADH:ubiquinone oxidoreductase subunit F
VLKKAFNALEGFRVGADCTITVNGSRKETVKAGSCLLFALWSRKIFIPSVCGGQGKCGRCKVKVVKGGGERLPAEEPLLTPEEKTQGIRLACQVQVTGDIEIRVPEKLVSARA